MNRIARQIPQSGAAAVEFALSFPIMFLLLYGLITFGSVFYTQLTVSRAVADGARALPQLLTLPAADRENGVKDQIIESLANSPVAPTASNTTLALRRAWLQANVRSRIAVQEAACAGSSGGTCAVITLSFPYGNGDGTRLLPTIDIPGIGLTESWMPDALVSAATVRL